MSSFTEASSLPVGSVEFALPLFGVGGLGVFGLLFKQVSATKQVEAVPHAVDSNDCTGEAKQMSVYLVSIPSSKTFLYRPPFLPLPISFAFLDLCSLSRFILSDT